MMKTTKKENATFLHDYSSYRFNPQIIKYNIDPFIENRLLTSHGNHML